jgi:hypothetical protein
MLLFIESNIKPYFFIRGTIPHNIEVRVVKTTETPATAWRSVKYLGTTSSANNIGIMVNIDQYGSPTF